ncbi:MULTISPECIES: Hcp family type VI secretion system effector [unclassified Pseudomonas]|uniref:Hcp family type VI secretion system effector n=1 Tax=unclassified Pseudomonas TaxID=196821 RepID=UPI002AC9EBAD|nr:MULTISPECIES: Hcp family type VI secretion system effector [unclassified Pseudomonas]MEB0040513.1 Hcp family type VI secretion system effector [Pseudomonas sp. MH10]MEB0077618.1 Hcp family type VI secretion system effector [Pseudomonas sp. MH10out]MEB0089638.1 Hcp family type VI secretion system effector [Pseudomonas sp. CCI4.2]MEB0101817.1 Hcp family type VI secretion system effector [Pseudomonas sp. CCI3.2]MEB0121235.1 Hcp family type VI secretion system effector [Pseudomonas sp. CCI1.2]
MAYHGYMTMTGTQQGLISAGCSSHESIGNKCQTAHTDEIMVLSFDHRMFNAENSNHATHQPALITKNIDKATPLLAQALSNRELVNCEITFYRISKFGTQEKFFTIKLKDCLIADQQMEMPHAVSENDAEPQEHIAIRYRDITWTHHLANTSGWSSWDDSAWNK